MRRLIACAAVAVLLSAPAMAARRVSQTMTTSWPGLTGLYIMPTARTIGKGNLCVGFNESKHTEFHQGQKFTDRQIRGVVLYGVTDNIEAYVSHYNNMYVVPPDRSPQLHNQKFTTFGLKIRLMKEHPRYWYPEISVAIRDIASDTADVGPLRNVNNGIKGFLIASKRLIEDERLGRFMDVHIAAAGDSQMFSANMGFELAVTANTSLIAEGIWDSPYLNFRDFGQDNVPGRYLFNTGVRIRPELIPGLAMDLGFVGDGEFEFSFGISYVFGL